MKILFMALVLFLSPWSVDSATSIKLAVKKISDKAPVAVKSRLKRDSNSQLHMGTFGDVRNDGHRSKDTEADVESSPEVALDEQFPIAELDQWYSTIKQGTHKKQETRRIEDLEQSMLNVFSDHTCKFVDSRAKTCVTQESVFRWNDVCHCVSSKSLQSQQYFICCYFLGQSTVMPELEGLPYTVLSFRNSSYLDVMLATDIDKIVYFKDVDDVVLNFDVEQSNSILVLYANNTKFNDLPPFRRYNLVQSRVDSIRNVPYLSGFSLTQCYVGELRGLNSREPLEHAEHLFLQFVMEKTKASHSFADSTDRIKNSMIGSIENCSFNSLQMNFSRIKTIVPKGLHIKDTLSLTQVTIDHLHREAIVTKDVEIYLNNVVVNDCDEPCFYVTKNIVEIVNLQVNGRNVIDTNDAAFSPGYRIPVVDYFNNYCSVDNNEELVTCDFSSTEKNANELQLDQSIKFGGTYNLILTNHSDIDFAEGCFEHVTLQNIHGYYHGLVDPRKPNPCDTRSAYLSLRNVSLTSLASRFVSRFESRNSASKVKFFNLGKVNYFNASKLSIVNLEHLDYRANDARDGFLYDRGTIQTINKLIIRSPATFRNVRIGEINQLVIDDDLSIVRDTLHIDSSSIAAIPFHRGIHVKRGVLKLTSVSLQTSDGIIYLEKDGKLIISGMKDKLNQIQCATGQKAISALHRSQVVYENGNRPDWLWQCVQIRKAEGQEPEGRETDLLEENMYSGVNPESCGGFNTRQLNCDLSSEENPVLLGRSTKFDKYKVVTLKGAKELHIGGHCVHMVRLMNLRCTRMAKEEHSCNYNLHIEYSTVNVITNNVWRLEIRSTNVTNLAPTTTVVKHLNIAQNSVVETMSINVESGMINDAVVKNIKKIHVERNLVIHNTVIHDIGINGILVKNMGHLIINSSTIGKLEWSSFLIYGRLTLYNVTVKSGVPGSFRAGPTSAFVFKEVRFGECSMGVLDMVGGPTIEMDAVTVEGTEAKTKRSLTLSSDSCHSVAQSELKDQAGVAETPQPEQSSNVLPYIVIGFILVVGGVFSLRNRTRIRDQVQSMGGWFGNLWGCSNAMTEESFEEPTHEQVREAHAADLRNTLRSDSVEEQAGSLEMQQQHPLNPQPGSPIVGQRRATPQLQRQPGTLFFEQHPDSPLIVRQLGTPYNRQQPGSTVAGLQPNIYAPQPGDPHSDQPSTSRAVMQEGGRQQPSPVTRILPYREAARQTRIRPTYSYDSSDYDEPVDSVPEELTKSRKIM